MSAPSIGHQGVWLGASDTQREGQWVWLNGTPLSSDFPWGQGQPDRNGRISNCLEIIREKDVRQYYNDYMCSDPRYFVCQL